MKKVYEVPEMDIQILVEDNVITTSGLTNGNSTSWDDVKEQW